MWAPHDDVLRTPRKFLDVRTVVSQGHRTAIEALLPWLHMWNWVKVLQDNHKTPLTVLQTLSQSSDTQKYASTFCNFSALTVFSLFIKWIHNTRSILTSWQLPAWLTDLFFSRPYTFIHKSLSLHTSLCNLNSTHKPTAWRSVSLMPKPWSMNNLCVTITKNFSCITLTVEHNCISSSSTVGIQLHVSALYVGHLQVVI